MATDRRRIGTEVATVVLVVACLGGTLNLVISVHRRAASPPKVAQAAPPPPAPAPEPPEPAIVAEAAPEPKPAPPLAPVVVEDPTPAALAKIAEAAAREREEAARLDREAAGLETARKTAEAQAESWRRREMLVKQQLAAMDEKARMAAVVADAQAARRDVLVRERDALKAAIAAAPGEGSFAVLPYQGENGTWRRPIVIECTGGQVSILPNGPSFSLLELSGLANPRSSPVVVAIARELLKVQNSASPDGSTVVPYFVFLVRPDGVKSYYEARSRLEPLGIAFGYELVDADMKIHVPNYDDVASWDGSPSLDVPASRPPVLGNGPRGLATHDGGRDGEGPAGVWPNGGGGDGDGPSTGGGLSWPGGPGGDLAGNRSRGVGGLHRTGANGSGANGGAEKTDDDRAIAGAFDLGRGRGRATRDGDGDGGGDGPESFVWSSQTPGVGRGTFNGAGEHHGDGGGGSEGPGPNPLGTGDATRGDSPLRQDVGRAGDMSSGIKAATRDIGRPDFSSRGVSGDYDRPGAGPNASGVRAGVHSAPGGPVQGEGGTEGTGIEPKDAKARGGATEKPSQEGGLMWGGSAPVGVTPGVAAGYRGGRLAGSTPGAKPAASGTNSTGDEPTGSGTESSPSATEGFAGDPAVAAGEGTASGSSSTSGSIGDGKRGSGASAAGRAGAASAAAGAPPGAAGSPPPLSLGVGGGGARIPFGLGSSGAPSTPGLMLGGESLPPSGGSAGSAPTHDPDMEPLIPDPEKKRPRSISVPFEIVVACSRDGVTIQPGNRRITTQALKNRRDEELLIRNLEAEAQRRAEIDPAIRPIPRVKFLVQEDGAGNFWEARRQILFSGLEWPMTLQVAGAQNPRLLDEKGVW